METGTEEDRYLIKRYTLLPQLQNLLSDEPRLRVLSASLDQHRQRSVQLLREEALAVFLGGSPNDLVGQIQNRLGAPVILFQFVDRRSRKLLGELHNVPKRGSAEAVDRLTIIPHHHHIVVRLRQFPDQVPLQTVGILIFVHEDVAITL